MFEIVKVVGSVVIARATRNCDAERAKNYIHGIIPEGKFLIPIDLGEAISFLKGIDSFLKEVANNESVLLYEEHERDYYYLGVPRNKDLDVKWLIARYDKDGGKWRVRSELIHGYSEISKGRILILRLSEN